MPLNSHCNYSYHITSRCNNREFRLTRLECRQVFLYILKQAIIKYDFKLYSLCIMSLWKKLIVCQVQNNPDFPLPPISLHFLILVQARSSVSRSQSSSLLNQVNL